MENFEIDRTDEEREELLKDWIKKYWLVVLAAIALSMAAIFAINYFKKERIEKLSNMAVDNNKVRLYLDANNIDAAESEVKKLQLNNGDTSFSTIATLSLAQKYFIEKKYNKAIEQYDWIISNSKDIAIRDIARLRKARSQADINKIKLAIKTLDELEGASFIAESYLLRGDILLRDNQFDAAKSAYELIPKNQKNININIVNQRLELVKIKEQIK